MTLRLVLMSDTHNQHRQINVPDGDVLVHAGDATGMGRAKEIADFGEWLSELPHKHKVIIAGNHDFMFEKAPTLARSLVGSRGVHYLHDQAVVIEGVKFYGSPYQPFFYDWAFNLPRGEALARKWAEIHDDTDVLITHGPPFGIGDLSLSDERTGCKDLLERVKQLNLKLHVFGHIHEGHGIYEPTDDGLEKTTFVNASICDRTYRPVLPVRVFEI